MDLRLITPAQLDQAREAADFLLGLPVRLDSELAIKLDTFRADVGAAIEDRQRNDPTACRAAKSD
ncbi:MAG TPA: hypothetical protein VGI74_22675 [Streptosporangiaceae bacterium]|jgi:hypothetical protein